MALDDPSLGVPVYWLGASFAPDGFALLGVSLAKLFLYDLSALSSVTRALSFLAVGAVLLLGGFLYQRLAGMTTRAATRPLTRSA